MKGFNKIVLLSLLLSLCSQAGYSQNPFLKAINTLKECIDQIGAFYNSTNAVDSLINRTKVKKMAGELYTNIGALIEAKDSTIFILEHDNYTATKYKESIAALQYKVKDLRATFNKYSHLVAASGVNAQVLDMKLREDAFQKDTILQLAGHLTENNSPDPNTKKKTIQYLRACTNLLKDSQRSLAIFNP